MHFQHNSYISPEMSSSDHMLVLQNARFELALEDRVLDEVKNIWHQITNEDVDSFMKFENRDGVEDDNNDE